MITRKIARSKIGDLTEEQRTELRKKRAEYAKKWRYKHLEERRKWEREHWSANRDHYNSYQNKRYHATQKVKRFTEKYGITEEEYKYWSSFENCQICGKKFGMRSHDKRYLDHCHTTGVVRGALCRDCNLSEGLMKTSAAAYKLYEYMKKNEELVGQKEEYGSGKL